MSKQRKLRNKLSFDEDEGGEDKPPPPPPAEPKPKKDSSKPKKSALLSFGDDEESALAPSKAKKDKSKVSKFHRGGIAATAPAAAAPAVQASSGTHVAPSWRCVYNILCTIQISCGVRCSSRCTLPQGLPECNCWCITARMTGCPGYDVYGSIVDILQVNTQQTS